ncbi:hypothetical protein AB0I53_19980 [Saccharopolyspora sp. NPDC050389]|uniref:hypothetical protein n=1 Tax=Saccharopolyspora sp. NPDC050389 TaxID=3155516 RepID=UPI0033E4E82F
MSERSARESEMVIHGQHNIDRMEVSMRRKLTWLAAVAGVAALVLLEATGVASAAGDPITGILGGLKLPLLGG